MRNRKQVTGSLAPSLGVVVMMERSGSLYGMRVGAGLEVLIWDEGGVGLEKWLGWSGWYAHLLGDAVCRVHAQYSAFALNTLLLFWTPQQWQLGFWSFGILSIICLTCTGMQISLIVSLYFVAQRDICPGCKHCSKVSQMPDCLPGLPFSVLLTMGLCQLYFSATDSLCGLGKITSLLKTSVSSPIKWRW